MASIIGSPLSLLLFLLSVNFLLCLSSPTSDLFDAWCEQHSKSYSSEEEKLYRLRVFEDNLAFVNQHNSLSNSTYTVGLNAFADLTQHEFRASKLGLSVFAASSHFDRSQLMQTTTMEPLGFVGGDVPESVDWREKGAITPVKDQARCGACWAFSATGAIEAVNQIVTGSLVSLSEQELIDCDKSYNRGCGGGFMDNAFQFVVKNHGIDTEEDYPYQAFDGSCNTNKLERRVVTIDGFVHLPAYNEEAILKAVTSQPVSVGLCGSERGFQLYSEGIFSGPCSTFVDHAVLIVGYGSQDGVNYWILKNSWGKNWGMNGYMHMLRNGIIGEAGVCGINKLASYPIKTSPNPPTSPSPSPTRCSLLSNCGVGESCCCGRRFFGICLSNHSICDAKTKKCLKAAENSTMAKGLEKNGSSWKFGGLNSLLEAWNM